MKMFEKKDKPSSVIFCFEENYHIELIKLSIHCK